MAFTQVQKKHLAVMIDSPKEFLAECENGKIYVPGFKNEFFQDGAGIFHLLVEAFIDTERFEFVHIIIYILKHGNELSLFQYSGRKDSAFALLLEGVKEDTSLAHIINQLLMNEPSIKSYNSSNLYSISSYAKVLGENGLIQELNDLVEIMPKLATESLLCHSLLKSAIEKQNLSLINFMLENENIKQTLDKNIEFYKFNIEKAYHTEKNVNIYSYCVSNNAQDILFKIIDVYGSKINFDGTLKEKGRDFPRDTLGDKSLHPLEIAIKHKDKNLFERYYLTTPNSVRIAWLNSGNHRLNYLYENSYEGVILNDLGNLFDDSEVAHVDKLKLFNQLLHFSKWHDNDSRYQTIESIMKPLWEKIPPINGADSFLGGKYLFNSFSSNGNMSTEEIDSFTNIFVKLKDAGHLEFCEGMFSNAFFNEPELVKKLITNGLNLSCLPSYRTLDAPAVNFEFNILEFFILRANKRKQQIDCNQSNNLDLDKAKQTLKIVYEHDKSLVFRDTSQKCSILDLAIEHNIREIFELLSIEDFKRIRAERGDAPLSKIKASYGPTDEYKKTFTICLEKLVEAGFDFSKTLQKTYEDHPIYYLLFDKVSDFKVLHKALVASNAKLEEDIQRSEFWLNLKTYNSVEFLKNSINSPIAPKNVVEILSRLSSSDTFGVNLNNFLEIFPDLHVTKLVDKENILHNAIKNDANQIAISLAKEYPDLAIDANVQNKMPVSYMIVKLTKILEKSSSHHWNTSKVDTNKELFNALINCGLESPNKRANKFLDEQLEKYSIIEKTFPNIIAEYRYAKLNRALSPNNAPSKKKTKI